MTYIHSAGIFKCIGNLAGKTW